MNAFMNTGFSLRSAAAIAAALLVTSGCGTTPPQQRNRTPAPTASLQTSPADLLLADAMRRHFVEGAGAALLLVEGAAQKAPDRPDIAWLRIALCRMAPGCQPEPLEARLRRLDPGNGIVWLGPLAKAQQQRDVAAENEILDAMSRSQRFDIYWNSLAARIAIARSQDPSLRTTVLSGGPLTSSLNDTIGWLSSVALPALSPIGESCSAQRAANPTIAGRCLSVAQAMQRGDTYIAEGMGLGIAQRLAPPASPQAIATDEQIELLHYQRDIAGQIMNGQLEREQFTNELLKLMSNQRREQDVFVAVIRWAGQSLLPPG